MHACRHLAGVWPTTPSLTSWTLTSASTWRGGQAPCPGFLREVLPSLLLATQHASALECYSCLLCRSLHLPGKCS